MEVIMTETVLLVDVAHGEKGGSSVGCERCTSEGR